MPQIITMEQNEQLMQPITHEEVKQALFQMHPDKSHGPDRMTPAFYQKHWSIVGDDVVVLTRTSFRIGLCHINLMQQM